MLSNDLVVFTITTDLTHPGVARLAKSALKYDIPLGIVGVSKEQPYKKIINTKHLLIRKRLEEFQELGFRNFLFLDAWDTVFVRDLYPELAYADNLYFGAEKNCYPIRQNEPRYTTQQELFPYLNSGVIWGEIETYLDLCPDAEGHDQGMWTEVYFASPEAITLDHSAGIVLNLHSTAAEDISRFPEGVRYNPSATWPCILHGNGKWPLPKWLEV